MSDVPLLTSMLVCGILLSLKEPWAGLSAMIDKLVLSSTALFSCFEILKIFDSVQLKWKLIEV